MFSAQIPDGNRKPLCIAITNSWEPMRLRTSRFTDVWSTFEEEIVESIPILLDVNCENVVVWRSQGMSARLRHELHMEEGEIFFSWVFTKSGSRRIDTNLKKDSED